ncbi:complement C3 [Bombina bombina]|uniref:complement C3 n=1 Tax=Bombina bombina TaxID=8345 RepID=UPI00235A90B4|nr:complement C3 [Bombina bombina]
MRFRPLCLTLFILISGSYAQPPCTLIAPSVLRVETEETLVLDAQGQNTGFQADIEVHDFPQKQGIIYKTNVNLNKDNDFLGSVKIKIPSQKLLKDTTKKQFVYVIVKSPQCPLERVFLLSFHSGYIFIQSDKTIYTPGSQVLYRIFIVGYSLTPDGRIVEVDFINPDNIVVDKNSFNSPTGIVSRSFSLPDIANVGKWQIVARFQVASQETFSTEFEVKEYVLPSFEVTLALAQNFFYVDDAEFSVDISATYLHGKPVEGTGYAVFGAVINDEKRSFPDSLTKIKVENGKANVVLKRHMITSIFRDPTMLMGYSLYVSVTVTTDAGSNLVEAEKTGIPIVNTAFKLLFTRTSKYFKPGMPYTLRILLQNPDGSPAEKIVVCTLQGNCGSSSEDGNVDISVNTAENSNELELKVETQAQNVSPNRQTSASITVQSYKPRGASNNYLHISVSSNHVKPGDNVNLNFNVKTKDNSFQHFTYLILNKGKIIEIERMKRNKDQNLVIKTLSITEDYIPSARIVAYYVTGDREIVSDSIWVDVADSCLKPLEVSHDKQRHDKEVEPGTKVYLNVRGDPGSNVGMVAVDKAVFVLNKKNRMSQSKIWNEVEQSDLGCTPGGGSDSAGVFTDAGLSIHTTTGLTNPARSELRCANAQRRRRSVLMNKEKAIKAKEYTDSRLRRCCEDGMQQNPMGYSCQRRATYVLDVGDCAAAFLECCKFIYEPQAVRRGGIRRPMITMSIFHRTSVVGSDTAKTDSDSDEDYADMWDFVSRSRFSESWLWKIQTLPLKKERDGLSTTVFTEHMPDSITTWEFLAIGLSSSSGICVAHPYELMGKKLFFIDLRLPYSVVRNEQVEIKAILHNYAPQNIEVRLDLIYNEQFCSSATKGNNYRQQVEINGGDSIVVPFIIVPLVTGEVQIEVKASVKSHVYTDGVIKKLRIVPEGMKVRKNIQSVILDPRRYETVPGMQIITIEPSPMKDVVPNSEPEIYISAKGDLLAETLENSIDGSKLSHLIVVPSGCGEQIMMAMTQSVIATHYLDTTNQWERIGLNRREEAIKNIKTGYVQQLVYKKTDHSYAAFTNRPASTWLTAYVVKVYAMASRLMHIDREVLCGSVTWLLNKQTPEGIFIEDAPVIHGEMVGGSSGTDPDASLTAFVLIALAEAEQFCKEEVKNLGSKMNKSADFLAVRINSLRKSYSVCIVSYALSLVGKFTDVKKLMSLSQSGSHWFDTSSQYFAIESTAYALLALLKTGSYHLTAPIAQWLTEQRFYGGGYGSTQATIIVFQALSEFQIHVPQMNDIEMDVSLSLPGRKQTVDWRINKDNAMLSRSQKTSMRDSIKVTAVGKGQGTLTVMSIYYAPMKDGAAPCRKFEFNVTLEEAQNAKKPEGAIKSMVINICMKFLGTADSTMTIVDLSLLTGFTPDMNDLDMLTNRVDKYISKYEMDTQRSERGSLILYLDKVSSTEIDCLKFKIHQNFEVGILQPASVTIYEYYSLENRCTKFYHPTKDQGELLRVCKGSECHCVAEHCNLRNAFEGTLGVQERLNAACEPGVDYVFLTRLEKIEETGSYDSFTVTVTKVVKQGTDEVLPKTQRIFFIHRSCRESLKLVLGNNYLIWGQTKDVWEMKKEISYVISGGTWIEEIPSNEKCQRESSTLCDEIDNFVDNLSSFGCNN